MSRKHASPLRPEQIAAVEDEDIDFSDIPELPERFFENARLVMPPAAGKVPVTLRIDADVLDWFKRQGKGHLTRMNAILRAYMESARHAPPPRDR